MCSIKSAAVIFSTTGGSQQRKQANAFTILSCHRHKRKKDIQCEILTLQQPVLENTQLEIGSSKDFTEKFFIELQIWIPTVSKLMIKADFPPLPNVWSCFSATLWTHMCSSPAAQGSAELNLLLYAGEAGRSSKEQAFQCSLKKEPPNDLMLHRQGALSLLCKNPTHWWCVCILWLPLLFIFLLFSGQSWQQSTVSG